MKPLRGLKGLKSKLRTPDGVVLALKLLLLGALRFDPQKEAETSW